MSKKFLLYCVSVFGFFMLVTCSNHNKVNLVRSGNVIADPPFKACHASTIVELENGTLMAAYFAGSYEGCDDVGIYTSKFVNERWSEPRLVAVGQIEDTVKSPCWNPVLFRGEDNTLYLFYKVGKNPREWFGLVKTSDDMGNTWSEPIRLPDGFLGPVRNKPIQLADGDILCPSSTESLDEKKWKVHMEITDSKLRKWQKVHVDTGSHYGVIQPTVLIHENGDLRILCRSRQNCIAQSVSTNLGRSWGNLSCTSVPNPNSGIDAVTLSNGKFLLVYNPLLKGEDWYVGRNVLKVAISKDAINWKDIYTLEDEPEGEFSYPAIIQAQNENIHITYTANRLNIKHIVLALQ
jgi:alpha-L-fucosidase